MPCVTYNSNMSTAAVRTTIRLWAWDPTHSVGSIQNLLHGGRSRIPYGIFFFHFRGSFFKNIFQSGDLSVFFLFRYHIGRPTFIPCGIVREQVRPRGRSTTGAPFHSQFTSRHLKFCTMALVFHGGPGTADQVGPPYAITHM
jgi:hypothetical protein